jgi:hypothetical protein
MSKSEFLCMPYKLCWCISRNWLCDSKKGLGRPIVRTEEVKEVVNDILQRMEQNPTKHMK